MKKWTSLIFLSLISCTPPLIRGAEEIVLDSSLTGRKLRSAVVLPAGYPVQTHAGKQWPLVLLLHGWGGNHRSFLMDSQAERDLANLGWIVVMPDGGTSLWCDSASDPKAAYESALVQELVPHIESRFRCSGHRVVTGFSVGGYGAIKLAFRHPKVFAGAIGLGAEVQTGDLSAEQETQFRQKDPRAWQLMTDILGPSDSEHRKANQLFQLAKDRPANGPRLVLVCGQREPSHRLESNRQFANAVAVTLKECDAGHRWEDYRAEFVQCLRTLVPQSE